MKTEDQQMQARMDYLEGWKDGACTYEDQRPTNRIYMMGWRAGYRMFQEAARFARRKFPKRRKRLKISRK